MNREGKSYQSLGRDNAGKKLLCTVIHSKKWSSYLSDEQSNYTHTCINMDPSKGDQQTFVVDERRYMSGASSWDESFVEI